MLWVLLPCYALLSPLVGLLVGSAIRVREVERPCAPAEPEPVGDVPAPVVQEPAALPEPRPVVVADLDAVRTFTGRTPRSLRPRWQQATLRTLGL
jgi:hypothetical protein